MSEDKKIIIDEDWKSQVEAEREALDQEPSQPEKAEPQAFPPASFEMLASMLATEAMMAMGQLPVPGSEKVEANLEQARYMIDMLEMLAEKTKGNLELPEENALKDLLHQLRMAFVAIQAEAKTQLGN